MRIRHTAVPGLLAGLALAAPAASQAATLTVTSSKPCYGINDLVSLAGAGFTPGGAVTVQQGQTTLTPGPTADAAGSFRGRAPVQLISANQQMAPYTATDQTDPAIVASTAPVRFSRVLVRGSKAGDNGLVQRVRARGFTTGSRKLYAHVRRGGRRIKDLRVGRLRGACRTLNVKRRFFSPGARPGSYRVYFDTYRRYKRKRRQQLTGTLTVFRTFGSSASGLR